MDKYFVTEKENKFYQRCANYIKEYEEVYEKAYQYLKKFAKEITKNEIGIVGENLYITDTKENKERFGKQLKNTPYAKFLGFRKNSEIAKGWHGEKPMKPMFIFDVLPIAPGRFSERLFIFENKLYVCCRCECDYETPQGFAEIKASEWYALCEKIQEEKLHVDIIQ